MATILPVELLHSLKQVKGFEEDAFQRVHQSGEQITSVRVNPAKPVDPDFFFDTGDKVPWSSYGYYLAERPSFTLDPLLHAGAYYVQEASSMFLEQCLAQAADLSAPLKILDLCAAPGGKSTLIQSMISNESLLVSNEVIKTRVNVLSENMAKWGGSNNIITSNDPRDFKRLENYFDVLVIDAPCSGSGLFRRDVSAIEEWSPQAVNLCNQRQRRILADAWPSLKKNGLLIYSTCSYSAEEDEAIADWLGEQFNVATVPIAVSPSWNIIETISPIKQARGYRFFPDKLKGEGLYISCFRKQDGGESASLHYKKNKWATVTAKDESSLRSWLKHTDEFHLYYQEKEIFAFPAAMEQELITIGMNLYLKKAGIRIGKMAQQDLIPAHELALSDLTGDKIVVIALKKEQALQYLRKEEVNITTSHRGWALVQYAGINLGWVKVLANRSNNYYPKEWRILKSGNN